MGKQFSRGYRRRKVHLRSRDKVLGTPERPRLCVVKSLKHMYAQLVDDTQGQTLTTVSSLNLGGKKLPNGGNISAAKEVGKSVAEKARELGVETVVFDRNGQLYRGRIKALAESAREAGLKF